MSTKGFIPTLKSFNTKKIIFISLIFAAIIALVTFMGITIFTNEVYIIDDDVEKRVLTTKNDINQILMDEEIVLRDDDTLEFTGFTDKTGTATILRAFDVNITADGVTTTVAALKGMTTDDVLDKAGVVVDEDDIVNLSSDGPLNAQCDITVKRVVVQNETVRVSVPFAVKTVQSPAYLKGKEVVTSEGTSGELEKTIKNVTVDGILTSTETISEELVVAPVDQVVTVGTAARETVSKLDTSGIAFDENGTPLNYSNILTGKSAGYSARPGARTASGRLAKVGHVAVDPKIIPYGTKLYITSKDSKDVYGYCIAADTGEALLDGRIMVDLFFDSYDNSCQWGVHQVNIYVLE